MRSAIVAGLVCAAGAACDRDADPAARRPPPRTDTGLVADTAPSRAELPESLRPLGAYLLVPGDTPSEGVIIPLQAGAPDSGLPTRGDRMTLITPTGAARDAVISEAPPHDSARCDVWSTARLRIGDRAPSAWSLGVRPGAAASLPVDTLHDLSSRDSASLVAAISRAASTIPDRGAPEFRGLPFVVRAAWRVSLPDGGRIVLADVERRINLEAMPRLERTAMLATAAPGARLERAWHDRLSGREEMVPTTDLLAALRVGASLAAVLARLDDTGSVYLILERLPAGRWEVGWTSADRGC